MEIVIVDDLALLRGGVVGPVEERRYEVTTMIDTAYDLVVDIDDRLDNTSGLPDLAIIDVRMPPKMSNDGLRVVVELCERYPQPNAMAPSQYVAPVYARELFSSGGVGGSAGVGTGVSLSGSSSSGGAGYLLKNRVGQVSDFLGSLEVVASGGVMTSPDVVIALMQPNKSGSVGLMACEREAFELMARDKPNKQIADNLVLSGATVAKYVPNILMKLHLEPEEEDRRVRAILESPTATSGQIQGRQQSHLSQRR